AVGRTLLVIVAPRLALRMLVEAVDSFPRRSAVARTEQTLWRGSCVPRGSFRRVARCQPERMIDDTAAALRKRRRFCRFLPRLCAISRTKDRRAQMAGARRRQQRARITRITDGVMNNMAMKQRSGKFPRVACKIARERPQALARGDQQSNTLRRRWA